MKINSAEIVMSAASVNQFPPSDLCEVAFAGKSNVGKSTLINSLLNRKKLVKTSATPGKTQLINFFLINKGFHLVDLPGYGYAKVPKKVQDQWRRLIESYLSERDVLKGVILIVDSRHGPNQADLQLKEWLDHYGREVLVIANKIDKLKKSQRHKQLKMIKDKMGLKSLPLPHSSIDKIGKPEIWNEISQWLGQIEDNENTEAL